MRKLTASLSLLALIAAGMAAVSVSTPASAGTTGGPITGMLVTGTSGAALSGYTVKLRTDNSAGSAVDETTSASDGSFTLTAPDGDRYYVQVIGTPRWQGGWAGGMAPAHIEFSFDSPATDTYEANDDLGLLPLPPAWMRGKVVRAGTGDPVRGIDVAVKKPDALPALATDTTNRRGIFYVEGLENEEFDVRLDGSDRGYETGFWACNDTVVPTRGEACSVGYGNQGKVRIEKLP